MALGHLQTPWPESPIELLTFRGNFSSMMGMMMKGVKAKLSILRASSECESPTSEL